jgi:uncharacterized membrane protein
VADKRIWEIDLLRVIAIGLMTVFHGVYDLREFVGVNVNYLSGFWYWVGKLSALLFIFLSGISSGLAERNNLGRGLKLLGLGMGISIVTYLFLEEEYVRFGILHLLGSAIILSPLLHKMKNWLLFLLAAILILASLPLKRILVQTSLFLPLGLMYPGFTTVDYYPLIPYLAVFILGVVVYKSYYYKKRSLFKNEYQNATVRRISKNSLLIYLVHQPIMLGIIFILKFLFD